MANQIIVIFDHSGSMSEPFSSHEGTSPAHIRGLAASHEIKIEEAKAQLIAWLQTSDYDEVTIIAFSSTAEEPLTFALPADLSKASRRILEFEASGGTNLASALRVAIAIGTRAPEDWFVRYLVVTDGLSETQAEDIDLVQKIPKAQGLDAILIDPTAVGETHLKRLCVRGRYIPVYGKEDLKEALEERRGFYKERTLIREQYGSVMSEAERLLPQLRSLQDRGAEHAGYSAEFHQQVAKVLNPLAAAVGMAELFLASLADAAFPEEKLREQIEQLQDLCRRAANLLRQSTGSERFGVSLAHPPRLSKGFSSKFLVQIYLPSEQRCVKKRIIETFGKAEVRETTSGSPLKPGMLVDIKLSSSAVDFSNAVTKQIEEHGAETRFFGKPRDDCRPGVHTGLLVVNDAKSNQEYQSMDFEVRIVDYAFDHISRPLLGRLVSLVVGVGSLVTFFLTFLGNVDKTFGLTSGTVGSALTAFLLTRTVNRYVKPSAITSQAPQQ